MTVEVTILVALTIYLLQMQINPKEMQQIDCKGLTIQWIVMVTQLKHIDNKSYLLGQCNIQSFHC
jgi:hypothetical protein